MTSQEFVQLVARLTLDGECAACRQTGENAECEDHEFFEASADDAWETLQDLIASARQIGESK